MTGIPCAVESRQQHIAPRGEGQQLQAPAEMAPALCQETAASLSQSGRTDRSTERPELDDTRACRPDARGALASARSGREGALEALEEGEQGVGRPVPARVAVGGC